TAMNILLVEDDAELADAVSAKVHELSDDVHLTTVGGRDDALGVLYSQFYDLIILDLKLPTLAGALDANVFHGYAVLTRSRMVAPGTPLLVLTGSSAED